MTFKRLRSKGGFTIVEVMITAVILLVAVLGSSGYRYYAALDARRAAQQAAAARIGLLLCESWHGMGGSATYNPVTHLGSSLAISAMTGFDGAGYKEADFTLLGSYQVVANNVTYAAVMSWKDVNSGLRALSVVVIWPVQNGNVDAQDSSQKTYELTTYTPI